MIFFWIKLEKNEDVKKYLFRLKKYFGFTYYEFDIFKKIEHPEICNYTIYQFEEFLKKKGINKFNINKDNYRPLNCNRFRIKLLNILENLKFIKSIQE